VQRKAYDGRIESGVGKGHARGVASNVGHSRGALAPGPGQHGRGGVEPGRPAAQRMKHDALHSCPAAHIEHPNESFFRDQAADCLAQGGEHPRGGQVVDRREKRVVIEHGGLTCNILMRRAAWT